MAEEEITAPPSNPLPSDPKRKIDDLRSQPPADVTLPDKDDSADVTLGDDSPSSKKPKLDDSKSDALPILNAHENGFKDQKEGEDAKDDANVNSQQGEGDTPPSPSDESAKKEQGEGDARDSPSEQVADVTDKEELAMDNHEIVNVQETSVRDSETEKTENVLKEEVDKACQENVEPASENQTTSHKMEIPNDKVGVLIGKGGDTIRFLQYNSGAKIQITKDADANPQSATRPVEIVGTSSSIQKAEKLIAAVIAEADAGGSPALVARGLTSTGTAGLGDQLEIQVPNDKVGLIIGKGGETIKSLQTKSGARIQLIPQHLPEGDGSKERTVRITGDGRKIEMAREMIMDVMNQTVRPSHHSSGFYQQQQYRPRGPSGPGHWGARGPPPSRSMPYDYQQRGPYPSQNAQYPGPHGSYPPQQIGPRSTYGSSWEQRPPSMQRSVPHGGGYDYYGGQGGNEPHRPPQSSALISGHAPGPSPSPSLSQANYFGHQAPYSQAAHPQQGYGHGYDEPKLHANAQHQYGHGNPQPVYPQPSNQPGYGAHHQYGKQPSYGVPSQGSGPQAYAAPPRPSLPGDAPYQPPVQSTHSYGSNVMQQQQYPYTSSAPMQQTYPQYGSVPAIDGYSQAQSTSTGYPQGAQAVQTYGQPAGQQAGYAFPSGVYGSYATSQPGYAEQPATGYQGPSDAAHGNNGQLGYAQQSSQYTQQPTTQPGYDPSVQQAGGYAAAPASAPVG